MSVRTHHQMSWSPGRLGSKSQDLKDAVITFRWLPHLPKPDRVYPTWLFSDEVTGSVGKACGWCCFFAGATTGSTVPAGGSCTGWRHGPAGTTRSCWTEANAGPARGQGQPCAPVQAEANWLGSGSVEKVEAPRGPGGLADHEAAMHPCSIYANRVQRRLHYKEHCQWSQRRPLSSIWYVWPHRRYCIQFWFLRCKKKNKDIPGQVQGRGPRAVRVLEHLSHKEKLIKVCLCSWEGSGPALLLSAPTWLEDIERPEPK